MIYSNYMREKYRNTNIPRTAEGYPCILKKSKKGNLKELVIEGNAGKNLFDTQGWYNWLRSFTTTYVTKEVVDETDCIYYRPPITYDKPFMEGCFKENTRYVLTFRAKGIAGTDTSTGFEFVYTDNTDSRMYVSNTDSWNNYTLISKENKTIKYIKMTYNYEYGCYFDENSIQLELGSTATEYEPYKAVGDLITDGDYAGKYKIPLTVHGKNLFNGYGFSAMGMITPTASRNLSNAVGTTISTTSPSNTLTVTQSNIYDSGTPNDYRNGYFCIGLNEDIKIGKIYRFYCDAEITNNPLNVSTFDLAPNNQMLGYTATYNNGKLIGTFFYKKNGNRRFLELRNRGCNMTISNIMITESKIKDNIYEPFLNPMITSIYLDNPLGSGECLDFKRQKLIKATSQTDVALPKVQVFKGTSVIRTDTEVSPTNIKAKYIKY